MCSLFPLVQTDLLHSNFRNKPCELRGFEDITDQPVANSFNSSKIFGLNCAKHTDA